MKVFDFNVTASGLSEKAANEANIKADAQWGTFTDSVEYYPESKNVHLKIIFDPETRKVIGFQGVGPGETVKRTDVITSLIRNQGTLEDVLDLEFAYAPPYAPPLDPLFALADRHRTRQQVWLQCLEGWQFRHHCLHLPERLLRLGIIPRSHCGHADEPRCHHQRLADNRFRIDISHSEWRFAFRQRPDDVRTIGQRRRTSPANGRRGKHISRDRRNQ